ncbi:MAG: hypothetical protein H8E61_02045 [Bacteroidetes bacterium]|nr:hypothetical protein [Bacteroidota bacterium]
MLLLIDGLLFYYLSEQFIAQRVSVPGARKACFDYFYLVYVKRKKNRSGTTSIETNSGNWFILGLNAFKEILVFG